jgi:hypothetical protein
MIEDKTPVNIVFILRLLFKKLFMKYFRCSCVFLWFSSRAFILSENSKIRTFKKYAYNLEFRNSLQIVLALAYDKPEM